MVYRKRPLGSSGVLAALLISPREFAYAVCGACSRRLYYTYAGEDCPFCGAAVTEFVEGRLPEARGGGPGRGQRAR